MIVILLLTAILGAVDFVPGSEETVSDSDRETTVYFHNNSDDEHWYGSNSWAVLFDFDEFAEGDDELQFRVTSAHVFIPNGDTGALLDVKLCTNNVNQPGDVLTFVDSLEVGNLEVIDGLYEIPFVDTFTDTLFWLVVDYATNNADTFISASSGDGTHSYFEEAGYYYNMSATGFNSEFLFELTGEFLTAGIDLELDSFELNDELLFGQPYLFPEFTITNHSEIDLDSDVFITLNSAPNNTTTLTFDVRISAEETEVFEYNDAQHAFPVTDNPSQFKTSASLDCEEDVFLYNNDISYSFDTFEVLVDTLLVENAVRYDSDAENIYSVQQTVFADNAEVISYFADASDTPFYNQFAEGRYHYYDLSGYPFTMLNGENRVTGYFGDYETLLTAEKNSILDTKKTYVEYITIEGTRNQFGDVEINIKTDSGRSQVFTEYLDNSSIYVAVAEYNIDEIYGGVMLKMLYENTGLEFPGGLMQDDFSFNLNYEFDTIADTTALKENCRLIYWIQNDDSRRVEHVGSLAFSEIGYLEVSADEESVSANPVDFRMFPSPFSSGSPLQISFEHLRSAEPLSCEIYNIKGQKVKQFPNLKNRTSIIWNGTDDSNKSVASGIYFINFRYNLAGIQKTITGKCLKIK